MVRAKKTGVRLGGWKTECLGGLMQLELVGTSKRASIQETMYRNPGRESLYGSDMKYDQIRLHESHKTSWQMLAVKNFNRNLDDKEYTIHQNQSILAQEPFLILAFESCQFLVVSQPNFLLQRTF